MRVTQVFVQHDYAFLFREMKMTAADVVKLASTLHTISVSEVKFIIKSKRPGVIVVTTDAASGKVICDLYGTVKNNDTKKSIGGSNGTATRI
ncbi:MAG: hypothetical protein A2Y16_05545 [Tenericutes bacterium GWF2_57_13]|nr:MAG: hypothetical protein A2Y16_05545 [Tenericutes bacterium GWF2_57_13]